MHDVDDGWMISTHSSWIAGAKIIIFFLLYILSSFFQGANDVLSHNEAARTRHDSYASDGWMMKMLKLLEKGKKFPTAVEKSFFNAKINFNPQNEEFNKQINRE